MTAYRPVSDSDRSALARLLQRAMDSQQPQPWRPADLVRATGLSYNTVKAWLKPTGQRSMPQAANLDRAADALHLSRDEVRRAAQLAAGYRVEELEHSDDPDLRVFLATYHDLTPEARERIMRTVRRLVDDPDLFPREAVTHSHRH